MSRIAPIGNEWNPPAAQFGPEADPPTPPPDPGMIEWWMRGTSFGDSGNTDHPWDEFTGGTLGNVFGSYGAPAIYVRKMSVNRVNPPNDTEILNQEIVTNEIAPLTAWSPNEAPDITEPTIEVYDAPTGRWVITLPGVALSDWGGGILEIWTEDPGLTLILSFAVDESDYASASWEYEWVGIG